MSKASANSRALRDGQKVLESDSFAAGSLFIGVLLAISHQVGKFTDQWPAFDQVKRQVLNPSIEFIVGRT
jgi:hypothetical protein